MSRPGYLSFYEQQALVKERAREPITWQGEVWYPTFVAAEISGWEPGYLRTKIKHIPGDNVVLTTPEGIRFVRLPRGRDDGRPPFYFDVESLKAVAHAKQLKRGRPPLSANKNKGSSQ